MFTGLIEEVGRVNRIHSNETVTRITIECKKVLNDAKIGDSISVNGVCLTVVEVVGNSFTADVMHETVNKTNISSYKENSSVNLERSLAVGERMGGHFVQGHVDGVAYLEKRTQIGNADLLRFSVSNTLTHWMVGKGSIAVNGISLTLVDVGSDFFTVSIIPHTLIKTNLGEMAVGDIVNIECDIVGKYIAKWAERGEVSYASH